jgi:hypothetical protein
MSSRKRKAPDDPTTPTPAGGARSNSSKVAEINKKIEKLKKEIGGIEQGTNDEFKIKLVAVEKRRQKALEEAEQNKNLQIQNIARYWRVTFARLSDFAYRISAVEG